MSLSAISSVIIWVLALTALCTYAALTQTPPFGNSPRLVFWLLNLDLVFLLGLSILVALRVFAVRRRERAAAGLHARLVYTFSLLAAVPVILMTLFSAFFFHYGLQAWLSQRVQTAIEESRSVAQAYLDEHRQVIRADTLAMAQDLDRQSSLLVLNPDRFKEFMGTQALLRNLSEAVVIDSHGKIIARTGISLSLEMKSLSPSLLRMTDAGEVVIMTGEGDDRVRALTKIGVDTNRYLFVGRMVDPQVLEHLTATQAASDDYANLKSQYMNLRIMMTLMYSVVGLLLVLVAIWFALVFAGRLVAPIGILIEATQRVRDGEADVQVGEVYKFAEFTRLAQAFNRMTDQIARGRAALVATNAQMEAVLSGVSSGILGLDNGGNIIFANASAAEILGHDALKGLPLVEVIPEAVPLLSAKAITQIEVNRPVGRRLLVRLSHGQGGMVLTFDDITDLEITQRKAAWADVARRIAHEIKNPLTPIQLAAERLGRRYIGQITEGAEVFSQCIQTIIAHVADIGRMVDEFSTFARMPAPTMDPQHIAPLVEEVLALQRPAHPTITFTFVAQDDVIVYCDARQIRQALTNIIQNAVEAIKAHRRKSGGHIAIDLRVSRSLQGVGQGGGETQQRQCALTIADNGPGLPKGHALEALTDPYVTHKVGGTGLGLAIVKKIVVDHGGVLELGHDEEMGGARVRLILPCNMA